MVPILNQIPKTVPGQINAASGLTDDGVVPTYQDSPLMPIIQAFLTADTAPLAVGSSTLTDTGLQIYLPIGEYIVSGGFYGTCPEDSAADCNGQMKLVKTGTIIEVSGSIYNAVIGSDGSFVFEYGTLINSQFDINSVSAGNLADLSVIFNTKVNVTVDGYLKVQVAQIGNNAPNLGVVLNAGSYLYAQRVG